MIEKIIAGAILAIVMDIIVVALALMHTNPAMFASMFPLTYFPYMGFKLMGDYLYLFICALLGFIIPYCDTNTYNT